MDPLPPLRALVAFEATARLGSMALAAGELGLTPSAVSHRIAALERHLGINLFRRTGGRLDLTREGKRLRASVVESLRRLAAACAEFQRPAAARQVSLHVAPSLAIKWVKPRLSAFLDANTGVELQVLEAAGPLPALGRGDVALVYGLHAPDGAETLLTEVVMPLCSPALAARLGRAARARDLLGLPLLHSRNAVGWREWCEKFGLRGVHLGGGLRFERSHFAIDAACDGRGVVLESDILTQEERRLGRLVAPLAADRWSMPSVGYALAVGPAMTSGARVLRDWLAAEASRP